MPNLWKFRTRPEAEQPKVEAFQFEDAGDLLIPLAADEPEPEPEESELPPEEEEPVLDEDLQFRDPVSYAQIQSDHILRDAERQAREILARAEEEARELQEQARAKAREEGYQAGYQQGLLEGSAEALAEGARAREAQAQRLEADVAAFLDRAQEALDRQMDENLTELRDLALAVAEKVVCVSLKSSSEVIGKMIQTAIDKRRHREWVHIYVAECDARKLAQMPDSLMAALAALSDRVRIIPMADDEVGTCIIEMPDEIVDASAYTQMNNIRNMLEDTPMGGREAAFQRRRSEDRVSAIDPSGL